MSNNSLIGNGFPPVIRPGISSQSLARSGIHHVTADEAHRWIGYQEGGILIHYFEYDGPQLMVNGRPFCRLRLDQPSAIAKYLSPRDSGCQLYCPPALRFLGFSEVLFLTEGEFKALALTEAGYPCVGVGGITCVCPGGEILPALSALIIERRPSKLAFIGDSDTALIYDFAREAVKLASLSGIPIVLPRIPFDAPGKGPDDLLAIWGAEFSSQWEKIFDDAVAVTNSTTPQSLALELLRRESVALARLDGDQRTKAREKIIRFAAAFPSDAVALSDVQKIAKTALDIDKAAFSAAIAAYRAKLRHEAGDRAVIEVCSAFKPDGSTPMAFDGTAYWRKESTGSFGKLCREDIRLHLNQAGLSKRGDPSPCDTALNRLQIENRVDYAGPLCGRPSGIHQENGLTVLVTRGVSVIKGAVGCCPTIFEFLSNLFGKAAGDAHASHQLALFLAWLKLARAAIRNSDRHLPGHVLALVGPPNCGKTLLQAAIITPALGGRCADPGLFFTGQTPFNADLWGAEHLMLGDKALDGTGAQRAVLRNELKRAVAETIYPLHGKGRDNLTFRPVWRISLSANSDPESVTNLPELDASFSDKIIYLMCYTPPNPFFDAKFPRAREMFGAKLQAELPAFLAVVDSTSVPEDLIKERFGIIEWHHPDIVELIGDSDPLRPLEDVISRWISEWPAGVQEKSLSTIELYGALNAAYLGNLAIHRISTTPGHLGHQLAQLSLRDAWKTRLSRTSSRTGGRVVNRLVRGWSVSR